MFWPRPRKFYVDLKWAGLWNDFMRTQCGRGLGNYMRTRFGRGLGNLTKTQWNTGSGLDFDTRGRGLRKFEESYGRGLGNFMWTRSALGFGMII